MIFLYLCIFIMFCSLLFSFYCIANTFDMRRYDRMLYPLCNDRRKAYTLLFDKRKELSKSDYDILSSSIKSMDGFIHEYHDLTSKNLINLKVFLESLEKTVKLGEKITLKIEGKVIEDGKVKSILTDFSTHFVCCFLGHTPFKMLLALLTTGIIARVHTGLRIGRGKTVERSATISRFKEKYKNYDCTHEQCIVS